MKILTREKGKKSIKIRMNHIKSQNNLGSCISYVYKCRIRITEKISAFLNEMLKKSQPNKGLCK